MWGAALALALLLSGCGAGRDAGYGFAPPEEDRLVIYTSHKEEVYGALVKEFSERTGIWVEVVTGGTNELLERIAAEADAPECDVMFGGGVESLVAYEGYFEPYTCSGAAVIKAGFRPEGDYYTPFSSLPMVLICNPKVVGEGEVDSWRDLLDEKWKGKIAFADPTVSGSSYTAALTLLSCVPGDDWAILERFVDNLDGQVLPDSGDVVESVRSGANYIGITLEAMVLQQQVQGADVSIVYPREGTSSVPDGSALVLGAPHPDNAKAFLEFVQGEDVQELVVDEFSRRPVRTDVAEPDYLPPEEALHIIDYDVRWAGGLKEEFTQRWLELMKEAQK